MSFGEKLFQTKLLSRLSHKVCRLLPSPVLLRKFTNDRTPETANTEPGYFFYLHCLFTLFCVQGVSVFSFELAFVLFLSWLPFNFSVLRL